ncbi:prolactin-releasing peptide receptor-like [Glandiceps talaboti]
MEFHDQNNNTITPTLPSWLLDHLHRQIIAYMLNRSATEGKYWESKNLNANTTEEEYYDAYRALNEDWVTALVCAFSFSITLSIVGNMIVLVVLSCGRTKSDLNLFLINLALADLTMAIFCMPFTFTTIMYGYWIFGTGMCPTVVFLQQVSVIVSIYTLTAIGIDRYYAVMYPLKVRVTKHRSKMLLGGIFVVAGSLAVVQTVFTKARRSSHDADIHYCDEWKPQTQLYELYEVFVVLSTYFLPLIVLMYTYARIGAKLWGRSLPGNAHNNRDRSYAASKKRVVKMLIVVVVTFAVCWLPLHIFNLVRTFDIYFYDNGDPLLQDKMRKINACVLWLAMSNSFMNPIIYSFLNDGFRVSIEWYYYTDMKDIFTRICCCRGRRRRTAFSNLRRKSKSRSLSSSSSFLAHSQLNRFLTLKTQRPARETGVNQDIEPNVICGMSNLPAMDMKAKGNEYVIC